VKGETEYIVLYSLTERKCSCPDWEFSGLYCKHIWAVNLYFHTGPYLELDQEVEKGYVEGEEDGPYLELDEEVENAEGEDISNSENSSDLENEVENLETNGDVKFLLNPPMVGRIENIRPLMVRTQNKLKFEAPFSSGVRSFPVDSIQSNSNNYGDVFSGKKGRQNKKMKR
jgi:hypothetical protein